MARKAEEVYEMYTGFSASDREKSNQTYDYMKQFTLDGINMLRKFFQNIGKRVQLMGARGGFLIICRRQLRY